jgi:DNA-binding FadR family transcriptional regulator
METPASDRTDAAIPPRRRRYLDVAEEILRSVALGNLRPGDRLPHERDLARRCEASRTTVREALLALELSGVVEIWPGAGCFMTEVSNKAGSLATLVRKRSRGNLWTCGCCSAVGGAAVRG